MIKDQVVYVSRVTDGGCTLATYQYQMADTSALPSCSTVLHCKHTCGCEMYIGTKEDGSLITINCRRRKIGSRILSERAYDAKCKRIMDNQREKISKLMANRTEDEVKRGTAFVSDVRISRFGSCRNSDKLVMCFKCMRFVRIGKFTEMEKV